MDSEIRAELDEVSARLKRLDGNVKRLDSDKAEHSDYGAMSAKVSKMETDSRTKFETVHADLQATNVTLRRLARSLESLQERLDAEEKAAPSPPPPPEAPRTPGPAMGWRVQTAVFFLAGVGVLALLQGAPHALAALMPGVLPR